MKFLKVIILHLLYYRTKQPDLYIKYLQTRLETKDYVK